MCVSIVTVTLLLERKEKRWGLGVSFVSSTSVLCVYDQEAPVVNAGIQRDFN